MYMYIVLEYHPTYFLIVYIRLWGNVTTKCTLNYYILDK